MVDKVQKRDGSLVPFQKSKIKQAILKAIHATSYKDDSIAENVLECVVDDLNRRFRNIIQMETIQDVVVENLKSYPIVHKAYVEYRKKRAEIRKLKEKMGIKDDLKLSVNSLVVLRKRYLLKDDAGNIIETPRQLFRRVANAIANSSSQEAEFFEAMKNLEFLPNTPTLMNSGTGLGQLSACFVLPVEDSLDGIYDAVKNQAKVQQSGGGTGFNFSKLRPKGDMVGSTKGVASGPVSFMTVFDKTTEVMKQGGKRRGANMGILDVTHPDIMEFITAKNDETMLQNFNVSVGVTDSFMDAVRKNKNYALINPHIHKKTSELNAKKVFDVIVENAWKKGDPGIIFMDEINKYNPTPQLGRMTATNPCGEIALLPYESCNLGSINLSKLVRDGKFDWKRLQELVKTGVNFLDNVIDKNKYPLKEIHDITKANRKIGLGVMGFAEMLIKLGIRYDSDEAVRIAEKVMKFIDEEARRESIELAIRKGSFPNFKGSIYDGKYSEIRNATVTTIAPTGTISIIAGCSSGIEPLFAIAFYRDILEGTKLLEVNTIFEEIARKEGFYSDKLIEEIAKTGSMRHVKNIPDKIKRLFVTALEINPVQHVKIQAAFQKYVDNSVSKTINLPKTATVEDVRKVYLLAHQLKCKGITIYRYGSKKQQVLYVDVPKNVLLAKPEFNGCPNGICLN